MRRRQIFETTDVYPAVCRCGATVLKGLSEGLHTTVDPWPADRLTEACALITGRWTYTLILGQLHRRAGSTPPGHVMIEHRCGAVLTRPTLTAGHPVDDLDPPF